MVLGTDGLIGWSVDWLIDWLIDWLVGPLKPAKEPVGKIDGFPGEMVYKTHLNQWFTHLFLTKLTDQKDTHAWPSLHARRKETPKNPGPGHQASPCSVLDLSLSGNLSLWAANLQIFSKHAKEPSKLIEKSKRGKNNLVSVALTPTAGSPESTGLVWGKPSVVSSAKSIRTQPELAALGQTRSTQNGLFPLGFPLNHPKASTILRTPLPPNELNKP